MKSEIVKKDKMLCLSCMGTHEVNTVEVLTTTEYKGTRLHTMLYRIIARFQMIIGKTKI